MRSLLHIAKSTALRSQAELGNERNGTALRSQAELGNERNSTALRSQAELGNERVGYVIAAAVPLILLFAAGFSVAEERSARQIYVPFSDLHVLLQNQPKRVLIDKKDYEELLKKAERAPDRDAPLPAVIAAADYSIAADRHRAEISGKLTIDVLRKGLHALPLDLAGVGLRAAKLDGRPAPIGLGSGGRLMLFVEGVGPHLLDLDMTAPLASTAARQVLNYRLPRPAAATLRLEAPGDVEIKGGADVISRQVDAAANLTRFELLPMPGDVSLVMTLNSHLLHAERAVIARSAVVAAVSEASEQLHAAVTMSILHRPVDRFRFAVPDGFEIIDVAAPLLSRWDVVSEDGRRVLEVRLNEPTTEKATLNVTAIRAPAKLDDWTVPRLEPLDVIGSVGVIGLKVDDRLTVESLAAEGLIPLDTSVLGGDARVLAAYYAPSGDYALKARFVRPPAEIAATASLLLVVSDKGLELQGGAAISPLMENRFYFDIAVPAGWQVTSVTDAGGRPLPFEFYPAIPGERNGGVDKGKIVYKYVERKSPAMPTRSADDDLKARVLEPGQYVISVAPAAGAVPNRADKSQEPQEQVPAEPTREPDAAQAPGPHMAAVADGVEKAGRVRVSVPRGMKVGEVFSARFTAVSTPSGWLGDWQEATFAFPYFAVLDATESETAIAVETRDDFAARPEKLAGLIPLSADERTRFGLSDRSISLAYRGSAADFTAALTAERTEPRLTARSISFFRVDRDALHCRGEIHYAVDQSRVRQFVLSLPENTPETIRIDGLDGVELKEYTGKLVGGRRWWTVLLAEPRRGRVRLAFDFQQRLTAADGKSHPLPIVEAEGVSYQSGLAAVEGCAELEVDVKAALPRVDVGELAEADYQPGRRLLGAYEFVGNPPPIEIGVVRRRGYAIPPAIVEKCELDTVISTEGWRRHQARFRLRTAALFLRVELPRGAVLWAAELDGLPLKPQRDDHGILVDLSAGKDAAAELKIIYADGKHRPIAARGTLNIPAPKLHVHLGLNAGNNNVGQVDNLSHKLSPGQVDNLSYEVPLADMVWRLHLPSGYEIVSAAGTLSTAEVSRPMPAAFQVAGILYAMSGGIGNSPAIPFPSGGCGCSAPIPRMRPPSDYDAPPLTLADGAGTRVTTSPEGSPHARPAPAFVGRITGTAGAKWSDDPDYIAPIGVGVALDRTYKLNSGLMEITYDSGAKVILEGPSNYEVETLAGGYLALGKIYLKNSNPTGDYILRTPTTVVTADPYAEIGAEVSLDGSTFVNTYSGRVHVLSSANGKELVMDNHGGAAVRVGDKDAPVPVDSTRSPAFTRRLPEPVKPLELQDIVAGGGGERWKRDPVRIPEPSAVEKQIEAALDSSTHFEFIETPLQDVIDYLKKFHHIEIQIDNRAMTDVGISADVPVTKNLKGISLRNALRLILKELGLTYLVQNEVLLITTPEEAETRMTTVVYPVADLVMDYRTKSGEVWTDYDSLIEILVSSIRPTTWDEVGGPGSIAPGRIGNTKNVIICQTKDVHEEIEEILKQIRRVAQTGEPKGEPPLRERPVEAKSGREMGYGNFGGGMGMGGMAPTGPGAPGDIDGLDGEKKREAGIDLGAESLRETPEEKPAAPSPAVDENKDVKQAAEPIVEKPKENIPPDPFGDDSSAEQAEKESAKRPGPETEFIDSQSEIEKRAVPFDDERPLTYPDAQMWKDLEGRRGREPSDYDKSDFDKYADLSGMRSLKIDLMQSLSDSGQTVTFQGLGARPRLSVTLADDSRFFKLRLGLALAVALVGAAITRRTLRVKTEYVLAVMLATTLGALIGGVEIARASNWMFFSASLLAPHYLLAGFMRWLYRLYRRACAGVCSALTAKNAAATLLLVVTALSVSASFAGEDAKQQAAEGPYFIQIAKPPAPIELPDDAIIIPYDPEWKNGVKDADKLLVPYDKYVELWNRAHPDKQIEKKAPPADYALADAAYKTTLDGDDFLTFTGRMQIDVFAEGYVRIPLGLAGGVISRAELDGKPARLSVPAALRSDTPEQAKQPPANQQKSPDRSVVILHVSGKGRHVLEIDARMKLRRQGGWRVVDGVLPSAPAAALDLIVPRAKTELRLDAVADCRRYDTERPDQAIRAALGENGAVRLRWRPEAVSGQIDRALTAASEAVFDVREHGLGLDWRLTLEFRNDERDRFDVDLPEGYLLEKVDGTNVRGWRLRTNAGRPAVEIELLQTAKDREQFTLRLWRGGPIGRSAPARFDVPVVAVPDAALQSGRLLIRRGPLLELQTLDRKGAARIDLPSGEAPSDGKAVPLGIQPFESYSFAAVPFTIQLSAAEVETRASAVVESVLKLAEYEQILESRVTFDVRRRPIHRLRVLLPEGYKLDAIRLPDVKAETGSVPSFRHTMTNQHGRPLLTVYLASGQEGKTALLIAGSLKRPLAEQSREMPLPRVEALDVDRQSGDVAVQTDPSFDVELLDPTGCESVLPGRLHGWLNPAQRELTRLALHTDGGDYSGKLRLTPRAPDVACDTITNVRVTPRALEETILLNYTVSRSGVRRLEFLLPDAMADSRISAPMMQRKTVAPAGEAYPGMVLATIELQQEAMGEIRVLIENDRLLTPGSHQAPMPIIVGENGSHTGTAARYAVRVDRRFAVLENAGRGELVVEREKSLGMEALGSHGKDWATLKGILGENITMAYAAASHAKQPRLTFHVASHEAVDTVKAAIGLAETTMMVDAAGAYRAEVVLKVNNETEQFLDVELPPGASLWTAHVAGEPVKPTLAPHGERPALDARLARIPLLKTAPGDLDYEVVLRYGGRMPSPGTIGAADFPMIRCLNVTPATCHATLHLPEQYHWFDFGGTMRLIADKKELDAGVLQYQYNKLRQITETIKSGDKWSQSRATANLERQLGLATQSAARVEADGYALNDTVVAGRRLLEESKRQAAVAGQMPPSSELADNRQKLSEAFAAQDVNPSKNVAIDAGRNWDAPSQTPEPAMGRKTQSMKMMVAPRTIVQEKEEEKLGVQRVISDAEKKPQQAQDAQAYDRYQQRLAAQTAIPDAGRGPVYAAPPPPPQKPPSEPAHRADSPVAFSPPAQPKQTIETPQATGLASLDFTLPARGRVYCFTAPRGDQRITSRYVSDDLARRMCEAAIVALAVAAFLLIAGMARRGRFDWLVNPAGTWLMLVLGLISLFSGILPGVGIVLIATAVVLKIRRLARRLSAHRQAIAG